MNHIILKAGQYNNHHKIQLFPELTAEYIFIVFLHF